MKPSNMNAFLSIISFHLLSFRKAGGARENPQKPGREKDAALSFLGRL